MTSFTRWQARRKIARSGLTLVELLIVCGIIVLFVAIAAPLMQPNTADRKTREAARQLNAYFAEAKSFAAQRGRAVALVFDRLGSANEGARDPNIITRLYLAEAPPHYSGDDLSSVVFANDGIPDPMNGFPNGHPGPIARNPRPNPDQGLYNVTQIQPPPWYTPYASPVPLAQPGLVEQFPPEEFDRNGNPQWANWYALNFSSAAMLNVIMASYLQGNPPARYAPFRIQFNGKGGYYEGYVDYDSGNNVYHYFCWAPYGKAPPLQSAPYRIEFPPVPSLDSQLEMPSGTVVDLQFSGFQYCDTMLPADVGPIEPAGSAFFSNGRQPLMIVFGPGGDVQQVFASGTVIFQPTRMHFLVGTADRAIDSATDANMPPLGTGTGRTTNLNDRACQWVSVNARTGYIATSDNAGFDTFPPNNSTMGGVPAAQYRGTAIGRARAMAAALNTKGGR
jgi:type II secretory pathway pseudopilin PulG